MSFYSEQLLKYKNIESHLILIGEEFNKSLNESFENIISFELRENAKGYISKIDWNHYSVFVKGSREMKLEELLPFSIME